MTVTRNLKSDGNLIYIITRCWYLAKMKLQYMNFLSVVTRCRIKVVVLTKKSEQANVIKKLSRFGMGIPIAPVWQSCGRPSTRFPHGHFLPKFPISSLKFQIFETKSRFLLEISFFKIFGRVKTYGSGAGIVSSTF